MLPLHLIFKKGHDRFAIKINFFKTLFSAIEQVKLFTFMLPWERAFHPTLPDKTRILILKFSWQVYVEMRLL
jgi:hypothetical protein